MLSGLKWQDKAESKASLGVLLFVIVSLGVISLDVIVFEVTLRRVALLGVDFFRFMLSREKFALPNWSLYALSMLYEATACAV